VKFKGENSPIFLFLKAIIMFYLAYKIVKKFEFNENVAYC